MHYMDLALPTAAENLACDEALLDFCEGTGAGEILRVWESSEYFVVVGYANKVDLEVNLEACQSRQIPILRRCSGGGTVVQGPGCLNYSLVLRIATNDSLQTVTQTNSFVMGRHRDIFENDSGNRVKIEGHTDLAVGGVKFSGNAQRRRKDYLLFHGVFLLDFDLELIEELLKMPSKQPDYREHRTHKKFLMNLKWTVAKMKERLRESWDASSISENKWEIPEALVAKYRSKEWNLRF